MNHEQLSLQQLRLKIEERRLLQHQLHQVDLEIASMMESVISLRSDHSRHDNQEMLADQFPADDMDALLHQFLLTPSTHEPVTLDFRPVENSLNAINTTSVIPLPNTNQTNFPRKRCPTPKENRICSMCGTSKTPAWRCTKTRRLVCNACGIWLKKNRKDLDPLLQPVTE